MLSWPMLMDGSHEDRLRDNFVYSIEMGYNRLNFIECYSVYSNIVEYISASHTGGLQCVFLREIV